MIDGFTVIIFFSDFALTNEVSILYFVIIKCILSQDYFSMQTKNTMEAMWKQSPAVLDLLVCSFMKKNKNKCIFIYWCVCFVLGGFFALGWCSPTFCAVRSGRRAGHPARGPVQHHPTTVGWWRCPELLHTGPRVPAKRLCGLVSASITWEWKEQEDICGRIWHCKAFKKKKKPHG